MLVIKLVNDGKGTDKNASYRYQVMVNDAVIANGEVKGHNRKDPWWMLVHLLAEQAGLEVKP
jgi:hypothetical protein